MQSDIVERLRNFTHQARPEIAEAADTIVRLRKETDEARAALKTYDERMNDIGTCGDGGCLIERPEGQHTNGGCRCSTDKYKAQRAMRQGQILAAAIRALAREMKLTNPQWALLRNANDAYCRVSQTYQPAKKLVELGLCVWREGRYTDYLDVTDTGRAALEQGKEGER